MADISKNDELQDVPTASETGRIDYSRPSYSQKEIDDKLAYFYARIDADKDTPGDQKENIKNLLKEMSTYDVGQRTLMQTPLNLNFRVDMQGDLARSGACAQYLPKEKTVVMPANAKGPEAIITLAHEMRHAIQNGQGLDEIQSSDPTDQVVQVKLSEMETKLQDIVFEYEIWERESRRGNTVPMSPGCHLYSEGLALYQRQGLTLGAAQRKARTDVVQAYWTGLNEVPVYFADLKDHRNQGQDTLVEDVNRWNNSYNLWTLRNFRWLHRLRGNVALEPRKWHKDDLMKLLNPAKKDSQEVPGKEELLACINSNHRNLIPKFIKNMDVEQSELWFLEKQHEIATVGDFHIADYYPNGDQKTVFIWFPGGRYTRRIFSERSAETGKQDTLHTVSFDQKQCRHGIETTYDPRTKVRWSISWEHGKRNGITERNTPTSVTMTEFKDDKKDGWETEIKGDSEKDYMRTTFYKDDKKEGLETIIEGDKTITTNYKDGKENGLHTVIRPGKKHTTEYKDGERDGVETEIDEETGFKHVVEWKEGKRHGLDQTDCADGSRIVIVWENDKMLKCQYFNKDSEEIEHPNKDYYKEAFGLEDTNETVESLLERIRHPQENVLSLQVASVQQEETGVVAAARVIKDPGLAAIEDLSEPKDSRTSKSTSATPLNIRPKGPQNG